MKIKKVNKQIFFRYLISYIIILIIPIIMVFYAFYKTVGIAEQNVKEYSLLTLEQSKNSLDSSIAELKNMVQQIVLNEDITKLVDRDLSNSNTTYDYWTIRKILSNFKISNNFTDSIYLVLKNGDAIISDSFSLRDLHFFYNNTLKYEGIEFDKWSDLVWGNCHNGTIIPASTITCNGKQERMVTYMHSVPSNGVNDAHGTIIVLIDEKKFTSCIKDMDKNGGWAYIADENGDVIAYVADDISMITPPWELGREIKNSSNLLMQHITSGYNGWTYAVAYPLGEIMSRVNYIKMVIAIVILIAILGGISIALLFTNKNSKPIISMIDTFRENFEGEINSDAYTFLQGSLNKLIKSNKMLKEDMKAKIPLLKAAFMDRLLKGGFNTIEDIRIASSSLEINLENKHYLVVMAKVNGYGSIKERKKLSELNMAKILIHRVVTRLADNELQVHDLEGEKIAILFAFDDEEKVQIEQWIESLACKAAQMLSKNNKINVSFSAGTLCSSLLEVYKSYHEAREALEYAISDNGEHIVWHDKIISEINYFYYYPIEAENKIMNLVRIGDAQQIFSILNDLYLENTKKRLLSKAITKFLVEDMKVTVIKAASQIKSFEDEDRTKIIDEMSGLENSSTIEEFLEKLKCLYSDLCLKSINSNNREELKEQIQEFINSVYCEPDLNLYKTAIQFDMTEKYFSKLFKELMGLTFSEYLENQRLSKAKEFLAKSQYTVNNIAELVGYTSAHSFRRAFKRVYGVLPTVYRNFD